MTPETLMQPRYKVIAEYPSMDYPLGYIYSDEKHKGAILLYKDTLFEKYPHLFKKLEWYEDRAIEDMPGYVKAETKEGLRVCRLRKFDPNESSQWCFYLDKEAIPYSCNHWFPATLEDYNNFINLS